MSGESQPQPAPGEPTPRESGESVELLDAKPKDERWFVPFVVIPLGLAAAIVGIVALANFLLGKTGPRSLDELLAEIQGGGANARKQAAFTLARNLNEEVQKSNERFVRSGGDPAAAPSTVLARRELEKIERAYLAAKGDPETRAYFLSALGLVGDDGTAEFLGHQLTDPDEPDADNARRINLILALGRIGSAAAGPVLQAELAKVRGGEIDEGVATAVAAAFGNLRGAEGTKGLLEILAVAKSVPVTTSSPATPRGGRWRFVRWTAAVNLAKRLKIDPEAAALAVPSLLEALADVADDPTRPEADRVFKSAASGGILGLPQADLNREKTAAQVIEALLVLNAKDAFPLMKRLAASDPNLRIRSIALDAAKHLGE